MRRTRKRRRERNVGEKLKNSGSWMMVKTDHDKGSHIFWNSVPF